MLRAVIAADSDALCYCFPSACGPARFEQVAASEDLNSEPGKDTASGEIGKSRTHPGGQSQNAHPLPFKATVCTYINVETNGALATNLAAWMKTAVTHAAWLLDQVCVPSCNLSILPVLL